MAAGPIQERNQDATIYVGGLDEKVTETILWELFLQAGPVVNVHMPKDRITMSHQSYGFVEFMSEEDADYAIKIMNMIKLYGKPVRVNKAASNSKNLDIGANLFIGNLDPEIDEKLLYDTFSAFGVILETPKIMRDPDSGNSKGFAFVKFASFDAADAAIDAMNGQHLCNRPISVSYAFKKEAKGERHGSAAERLLAAQNPLSQADRPHQIFADAPPSHPVPPPENRPTQKAPERILHPQTIPNMQPIVRAPPPLFSAPPPPMQGMIPPALMRAPPPPPPGSFPMGPPPGQMGNIPPGQIPFRPPPPPGAFQPPPGMMPLLGPPPGGLPAPPPPPGGFSAPPPPPGSGGAVPPRPLFTGVPPPPPEQ